MNHYPHEGQKVRLIFYPEQTGRIVNLRPPTADERQKEEHLGRVPCVIAMVRWDSKPFRHAQQPHETEIPIDRLEEVNSSV